MSDHIPLPSDGAERRIFLASLRRFSDMCEAPDLLPDCPFSVDLPGGQGRGCGEECLELLVKFGSPPGANEISLGRTGMFASEMRARRHAKADANRRPFDASESYIRDNENNDISRWQTVSLFYKLRSALVEFSSHPPTDADAERSWACAEELIRRKFDVERIVKVGLLDQITFGCIISALLAGRTLGDDDEDDTNIENLKGWALLWHETEGRSTEISSSEDMAQALVHAITGEFAKRIKAWISTASLQDILLNQVPSLEAYLALPLQGDEEGTGERKAYRWIVDRFALTYLGDWSPSSLKLEWKFQQGKQEPPCLRAEMEARIVDTNALARIIADQQTSREPSQGRHSLLRRPAIRFLEEGRRAAASAVFEAACEVSPADPEIRNNYGFCILPDDPEAALSALDHAARHGYSATVNYCNRALALFRLGRYAAALELAQRIVDTWEGQEHDASLLWKFESDEAELISRACPCCYMLELAVLVAKASGDHLVEARWSATRDRLLTHPDGLIDSRPTHRPE